MFSIGIARLLSYLWKHEGKAFQGKPGDMEKRTCKNGALEVRMGHNDDPDSTELSSYLLNLSPEMQQGLQQYLLTKKGSGLKQSPTILNSCIKDSMRLNCRRLIYVFGSIMLLAMVLLLLGMLFSTRESGISVPEGACMTLLALLWLVVTFSRGWRCKQAALKLKTASEAEVPVILDEAMPYASRNVFASVNKPLGLTLLIGCIGCFLLEVLPERTLMTPAQRVEDYYSADDLLWEMEDAEKALSLMPSKVAESLLQEKIDSLPEGDLKAFLSGALAARLEKLGKFTQAQAESLADRALARHPISSLDPNYGRDTYLAETVAASSEAFRRDYPARISELPKLDARILAAVGQGMAGMDTGVLVEGYNALMAKEQDGAAFLSSAVGTVSSVEEAEALLKAAPEDHRPALCSAYAASFTAPDDVLAYLRMAASLGIPLDRCAPDSIRIQLDLSRCLVSAEPSDHLPEGPYTILPLLRTEDGYQYTESDTDHQDVRLWTEALAALPADRIPQTLKEADLILLMDSQFVSNGRYTLNYKDWENNRQSLYFSKFDSLQRLGGYDAATGQCLLVVDELSRQPEQLPRSLANRINNVDPWYLLHAIDDIEPYRYGAPDKEWEKQLHQVFLESLKTHGGDLSACW